MATLTFDDENLAETDEYFYENANMIDYEPLYRNFTAIQNDLLQYDEQIQLNTIQSFDSTNIKYETEPVHLNGNADVNFPDLSKTTDRSILNLIQIIEDIGYNPQSPFLNFSSNKNTLSNMTYNHDEVHESCANNPPIHIDRQYYQSWYHDRYRRSASMIPYYSVNQACRNTTQTQSDDNRLDSVNQSSVKTDVTVKQMSDNCFQNKINLIYGSDDLDTISSVSSHYSSVDGKNSPTVSERSVTPITLKKIENSKPKQITIREYYPRKDVQSLMVNGSISPRSQRNIHNNSYEQNLYNNSYEQNRRNNRYEQNLHNIPYEQNRYNNSYEQNNSYEPIIHNCTDMYQDPNTDIITKPNPDKVVYKQKITVRYLVPPTPPVPGPLIIREILPPRPPSPSPLIIEQQEPAPPTPSPLILREMPPPPPPIQEPKIITKMVPQESQSSQHAIAESNHPLPPKPQSIIIEKWLPYKPSPPREVIYERVVESSSSAAEFQPTDTITNCEGRNSNSIPRLSIPVHIEQSKSYDYLDKQQQQPLSAFDQLAQATQQQLEAIQQQVVKQMQIQQQWLANQHQQHMNMCMQMPLTLTTPALVINHPPITRTTNLYTSTDAFQQQIFCQQPFMYPSYI
ncbi:unnamed protein product [Adineta steineri]|uniref:Uncharacterized protein n=1 Tax=Adineta steineri TaxID=433720 RepID=A0A814XVB2_9BILA|nr:unnamed protein product [Adineta steineri]CAF1436795.1 unnamed protein product [Adineta steineri]